ncbi:hypothetical protein EV421DRAFT_1744171 [Armillaria borealis]|uniref:Uncharacterized protein n=1 Tax=Armillaria borealis TaxID=47425 RepID=A0AA39ITS0_9AGAR|nr:hypothetical protein EV421DRAFT_1744171 [Armillaria borealis]
MCRYRKIIDYMPPFNHFRVRDEVRHHVIGSRALHPLLDAPEQFDPAFVLHAYNRDPQERTADHTPSSYATMSSSSSASDRAIIDSDAHCPAVLTAGDSRLALPAHVLYGRVLKLNAHDADLHRDFDDFLHTAVFTTKHLKGHEGYVVLIPAQYWPDILPFTSSFRLHGATQHNAPGGQTDAVFAKWLLSAFVVAGLVIGHAEGVLGRPYEFLGFAKHRFLPVLKAAANAPEQSSAISELEQDCPVMLIKGSQQDSMFVTSQFQGHEGTAVHIPSQYSLQLLPYISSVDLDELAPKQQKGGVLAGFLFAVTLTAMFISLVWALESLDSVIYVFCASSYITLGKAVDTIEFAILQATIILSLYLLWAIL